MFGENKMQLNQETIVAALQHYFETVVFASGEVPRVKTVTKEAYGDWFEVVVQSTDTSGPGF